MLRVLISLLLLASPALARDPEGKYAYSPLKPWFDSLTSKDGVPCCSTSDGRTVEDPDWGSEGDHYWVIVDGKRYIVPDKAVIRQPNKAGLAIVWPVKVPFASPDVVIRCFLPGVEG